MLDPQLIDIDDEPIDPIASGVLSGIDPLDRTLEGTSSRVPPYTSQSSNYFHINLLFHCIYILHYIE